MSNDDEEALRRKEYLVVFLISLNMNLMYGNTAKSAV